jgi:hypothetical protein
MKISVLFIIKKYNNMKNKINLSILTLALFIAASSMSCKKPSTKNEDKCKCKNTMQVVAQDLIGNCTNNQNNGLVFIENLNELQVMVKPGNTYEISYDEVPCKLMICEGGDSKGFDKGGCYPKKICVKVCTMKQLKCGAKENNCNGSTKENVYNSFPSMALSSAAVSKDVLNVMCGYSGCDETQFQNLVLAYDLNYYLNGIGPKSIIPVRIVDLTDLPVCQAYFTKNVCFDLAEIKNFILTNNAKPAPKTVYLKMLYNDSTTKEIAWDIN